MSIAQVAAISMPSATMDTCISTDMVVLQQPLTLRAHAKKSPGCRAKTSASRTRCVVRRLTAPTKQRASQQAVARVARRSFRTSTAQAAAISMLSATTTTCISTDMVALLLHRTLPVRAKRSPAGSLTKTSASRILRAVRRLTALTHQRVLQQALAQVGWSSEHRSPSPRGGRLVEYSFCAPFGH